MEQDIYEIIKNLDVIALKHYIKSGGNVSDIAISYVIEQIHGIDEDLFWNDFDVRENAVELMREIDKRKAEFIEVLLNADVIPDMDALVACYTFRAPQTARVLLEHGVNPNIDWEGGESCVGFANGGLSYIGMNKASEVLVKEYRDTLQEFGGLYLNFLFTNVYYDDWQMQCCGEPFHVGDRIELLVEKDFENSKWDCTFHEEHHYTENRQYVLKGKVKELSAEIIRPPHDKETLIEKLREHSELIPISYADGYAEIPQDCKFLGYVITMEEYTVENRRSVMDIFVGLQASGKTSYVKPPKYYDYVHINLDTLKTRGREHRTLIDALRARKNVVIDNTNPSVDDRKKYIIEAQRYGYEVVCHFFQSKLKDCIERNALRENPIPVAGLVDTSRRMDLPTKAEGYSEMYFVQMKDGHFDESKWIEE